MARKKIIISVLNPKGGTFKSTVAQAIASSEPVSKHFDTRVIVELDPMGNLKRWFEKRSLNYSDSSDTVIVKHIPYSEGGGSGLSQKRFSDAMSDTYNSFDFMILDAPGQSEAKFATRFALKMAQAVVIPMRTSTNDEDCFHEHIKPLVKEFSDSDIKRRFFILPISVNPRASTSKLIDYIRGFGDPFECLETPFYSNPVFENFNREGATLQDHLKDNKKNARYFKRVGRAVSNVDTMSREILVKMGVI